MDGVLTSVASLVKEGFFGDVEFVKAVYNEGSDVGAQFASSLLFVDLTVKCASGEKLLPLFIKSQRGAIEHQTHFYNEMILYRDIIPALGFDEGSYPKLYYGKVEDENKEENLLIFEDLRIKNFVACKLPLFLDFEHIAIALRKIALFHSRSFILKQEDVEKFYNWSSKMKAHDYRSLYKMFDEIHRAAAERGKMAFQEVHGVDQALDDLLEVWKEDPFKTWEELLSPEEPFEVIGHGDFCNNNLLIKYGDDGAPIDCALIDFQRGAYLSLGSELAFYLYMHTTAELREKHWDEFLRIYWETLKQNVPKHIKIPSFEDFLLHFARRAIYGYFITCFFIPVMIEHPTKSIAEMTLEEYLEYTRTAGGKEADEKLADILSHIYHKEYLHTYLQSVRQKDVTNGK